MQLRARVVLIVFAALALAVWAPPSPARAAATLNVPSDYATIQAAINAAVDGDTVLVAPGTYTENLNITTSITVASSGGASVTTIHGAGGGEPAVSMHPQWFVTPTLRGFTITGGSGTFGGGVYLLGQGDATISQNVITANTSGGSGGGLDVNGGGSSVIERNVITGNTSQNGGGISIVNAMTPTFRNNLIVGNTASNSGGGVYTGVPSGSTGPSFRNNTIVGNTAAIGSGILADGFDSGSVLRNNVVMSATAAAAIECPDMYDHLSPQLISNDVVNTAGPTYGGTCVGTTGTGGNVSVDPRFVDAARGNYHLRADSPLIDAGSLDATVALDIDGDARPFDGDENGTAVIDPGFDEAVDPLLVDPPYLYMGNVDVGATGTGTVTLTNLGGSPLSITSATVGGADAADFAVAVPQDDTCGGVALAVGASCHVKVTVVPSVIAPRHATLTVTGPGAVGTRVIQLEAVGIDPILVLGGPMAFGDVVRGASSQARQAEVDNYGPSVSITSVTVGGPAAADFAINADTCSGQAIPMTGKCTFGVTFTPKAAGARTATVSITGPGIVGTRTIDLSGTGTPPPSGVVWGTTYSASPSYAWNDGFGLAQSMQGTTQRLHGLYATDRIGSSWAKSTGPYEGVYYTRSTSGTTWSTGKRLNPTTQHAQRLAIAAAGSRVYATWVSQRSLTVSSTSTSARVLYVRVNTSYGDSASWKTAIRLTSTTGRVDYPSVAASGTDVHIAWTDSATGSVKLATSKDRGVTWKTVTVGSTTGGTSANKAGFPTVAVSGSVVLVTWQADNLGAIKARVSTNRATSWGSIRTLTTASYGYFAAAVRGSLLAVTWTGDDGVVLSTQIGASWAAPVVVAPSDGVHAQFSPAVSLQAGSRIGIAWAEDAATSGRSDLHWVESPDGGASWYLSQLIGSSSASSARRDNDWPSVVWPAASTRYVAWNGWTPGTSYYRLYVRKGAGTPVGITSAGEPLVPAGAAAPQRTTAAAAPSRNLDARTRR